MSNRYSSETRREQIVEAVLGLLADTPIDRLTTRDIAERVGVTQPALFRHFESRDEILKAVAEHAAARLGEAAQGLLAAGHMPLEAMEHLTRTLLLFAVQNPGIPALLFHDVATGEDASFHRPLRHLVTMQTAFVAELVRQAQEQGSLVEELDPAGAATFFVALVQGTLLQWRHTDLKIDPQQDAARLFGFWLAGVRAGLPGAAAGTGELDDELDGIAGPIVALDVRPSIRDGDDPLDRILAALARTPVDGILVLTAPFKPAPLLTLLAGKGCTSICRQAEHGVWVVEVTQAEGPNLQDLTDLEAPEPMEQVLLETLKLAAGEAFIARLPRFPRLLLPHLHERGLSFDVHEEPDGTTVLHVRKPG